MSLRKALTVTLLLLGILGMILVSLSSAVYRHLAYEDKTDALQQIISLKTKDLLEESLQHASELGFSLQRDSALRSALQTHDESALITTLDNHFHRYIVTMGLLKLEKLFVLNTEFRVAAQSREGVRLPVGFNSLICDDVLNLAKARQGPERLKTIHYLCSHEGRPYLTTLVAVGGLKAIGYVAVVTDPLHHVSKMAQELGLPVRISLPSRDFAFTSSSWPTKIDDDNLLIATFTHLSDNAAPAFTVEIAASLVAFNAKLAHTRNIVLATSAFSIVIALTIALLILRSGGRDLNKLQKAADDVAKGQYHMVKSPVYSEVRELTRSFNHMSIQIRAHHDHLGELVKIRTRELERANQKLGRDIDRHKELEKLKDDFIAMMNHEIRTPVTAIKGALDLLLVDSLASIPEQSKSLVTLGRQNCDRLLCLLSNILEIQSIESGDIEYHFTEIPINPVLDRALENSRHFGDRYKVNFRVQRNDASTKIYADEERLTQVIVSLLANAAKHSTPGDEVILSTLRSDNHINISVEDHGPGIPESFRDKVFEKFTQADDGDLRTPGSSGTGLFIARQLIEGMKGKMHFVTETDVGTTFSIVLPESKNDTVA